MEDNTYGGKQCLNCFKKLNDTHNLKRFITIAFFDRTYDFCINNNKTDNTSNILVAGVLVSGTINKIYVQKKSIIQ